MNDLYSKQHAQVAQLKIPQNVAQDDGFFQCITTLKSFLEKYSVVSGGSCINDRLSLAYIIYNLELNMSVNCSRNSLNTVFPSNYE